MALVGGHRPYPTHTKLGRIMFKRGLRASDVTYEAKVYSRQMTEYLAGRKKPTATNMVKLSTFLGVSVEALTEKKYPWLKEDQEKLEAEQAQVREKEQVG